MALKLIAAPEKEPVTLAEAAAQCRVNVGEDDAKLNFLITAAREQAEHQTGRALITQTWELVANSFAPTLVLRHPPILSVTSVKYQDTANATQTLDVSGYFLDKDSEPGLLLPAYGMQWPATYPMPNSVRVRYTAGYGVEPTSVPLSIKQWMLLMISTWYDKRDTLVPGTFYTMPRQLWDALLDPYRLYDL